MFKTVITLYSKDTNELSNQLCEIQKAIRMNFSSEADRFTYNALNITVESDLLERYPVPVCPDCGSSNYTVDGVDWEGKTLFACNNCGYQFYEPDVDLEEIE